MAKDLPYFKFFCSEWSDGDITLEDLHVQGLFINVCAYYWSKECNLSVDKLMKKFQNHPLNLLETLFSEGIIKQVKGMVKISFLDEQYGERNNLCNQNSINAKKGWEKRKKIKNISDRNATASNPQYESDAKGMQYREEERREEKIRKDKSNTLTLNTSEGDSLKNIDVEVEDDKLHDFKYKDYNEFLKDWNNARKHFEKKESNISRLSYDELNDFKRLKQDFTIDDFKNGIRGLFMQKQMFATNRLRPRHFLQEMNIEKYIDCHNNKIQLFEDKSKNQRL
jgi:hypothetical protein